MAHQVPKVIAAVVSSAGTRVPLVASNSPYRFAKSFTVEAKQDNTGAVYLGDASVDDDLYGAKLVGTDKDRQACVNADQIEDCPGSSRNYADLNAWYIDADDSGDGVNILIQLY